MKTLIRILSYLALHRSLFILTLMFASLATAFELLPPWLIKITIDDVIQDNQRSLLVWVLGGLICAYGFKNLFNSLRIRFNNILEQRVIFDIRQQVFYALQRQSINFFERRSTGEIMSRLMNDTEQVERIFIDGLEGMLTASLTLTGITVLLFSLNWKLALLALIPIPLLVISAIWFSRKVHSYYHEIRENTADLNAYLQDALSGIRETIGFNRHSYECSRFDIKSHKVNASNLKAMFLWSMYSPAMIFIGSLGTVMILWYGTSEVIAGHLSVGELVAFISYLALFYVPVNQIHSVNHMLQQALVSSERIFEVLDSQPEVADSSMEIATLSRIAGRVSIDQLMFSYRRNMPVLRDITINIESGERVALVGPSGAGKSTFIKLIMRLHDVVEGTVCLDGVDVRNLPLAFVRSQIGLVQQEPFLFNGTVRENIIYGNLDATQKDIDGVAIAARAHEFILDLPEKYETWIGERGVKLSVGQKQRIAIARVLLKDPPIVVFDEATSNIDTETEVKIREALEILTQDRTTIIIAHRLTTLQQVGRILVLENGQIMEEGTHESLLARGGVYSGLYKAQFQI